MFGIKLEIKGLDKDKFSKQSINRPLHLEIYSVSKKAPCLR